MTSLEFAVSAKEEGTEPVKLVVSLQAGAGSPVPSLWRWRVEAVGIWTNVRSPAGWCAVLAPERGFLVCGPFPSGRGRP